MKNTIKITIMIVSLIIVSCTPTSKAPKASNLFFTFSPTVKSVILDSSKIDFIVNNHRYVKKGKHIIKINDTEYNFELKSNEKILINLGRDSIFKEELIYGNEIGRTIHNAKSEFKTPLALYAIHKKLYAGYYQLTNETIIQGWDYGLGEIPGQSINVGDDYFFMKRFYKIYTVDEFVANVKAISDNNKFIQNTLDDNIENLDEKYEILVTQNNYLKVRLLNSNKYNTVGKVVLDDKYRLEISPNLYDYKKHGKITKQVAVIKACIFKDDKLKKIKKTAIVFSSKSKQPHIKVLK